MIDGVGKIDDARLGQIWRATGGHSQLHFDHAVFGIDPNHLRVVEPRERFPFRGLTLNLRRAIVGDSGSGSDHLQSAGNRHNDAAFDGNGCCFRSRRQRAGRAELLTGKARAARFAAGVRPNKRQCVCRAALPRQGDRRVVRAARWVSVRDL